VSPLNPLKHALAEGRATLGYLVSMPSVQLVQALARTGVDWLMSTPSTRRSASSRWPP
jgi:2-keto-3-deoxy-L-rhamnonate aldolase RhmA